MAHPGALIIAFDDGPLETTGPILDILHTYEAKASFFVVGTHIKGREKLLERMRDEGHDIGNHSWSHARLTDLPDDEIAEEIDRCDQAIYAACGVTPAVFRPPFVAYDDRVIDTANRLTLVEPSFGDYALTATEIIDEALKHERLYLHDGHLPTVEALPAILAARS